MYSKMEQDMGVVVYTVQSEASLKLIAEKFRVSEAELQKLNPAATNSNLPAGTILHIPVAAVLMPSCSSGCVELFYEVKAKEGLYRIGKNFGYQNATTIKQLNALRSESLHIGQLLLLGYLPKELFSPAVVKQESIAIEAKQTPASKPAEPAFTEIKKTQPIPVDTASVINMQYRGEGVFKTDYAPGGGNALLHAAIFKTEAGWSDGKFYVLADLVPVGKVVKIQHPVTGAVLYAKVLGELPKLPKKDQVQIRICSAAAYALGMGENDLFEIQLSY